MAILVALLSLESASAQSSPPLHLEAIYTRSLPDSFAVTGVSASSSGAVAYWAADQPYIIVDTDTQRHVIEAKQVGLPVAVAVLGGDSIVEVVDGRTPRIIRLSMTGQVLGERSVDLPFSIEHGARANGVWIVVGKDSANIKVMSIADGGEVKAIDSPSPLTSAWSRSSAYITGWQAGYSVSLIGSPFDAYAIDSDGSRTPVHFVQPLLPESDTSSYQPLWISMPIVRLETGFLRTFADLRSDTRILVLYDDHGNISRQTLIRSPLGFVASLPERRLLIAIRKSDQLEVVGYRWRRGVGDHDTNHKETP
ncbi:MAG TPA: hypothetical protein VHG28_03960 [Longimicrobiaceae bacterium]|nr:hypothetical protein [Longimicrobiaceae bacterium]